MVLEKIAGVKYVHYVSVCTYNKVYTPKFSSAYCVINSGSDVGSPSLVCSVEICPKGNFCFWSFCENTARTVCPWLFSTPECFPHPGISWLSFGSICICFGSLFSPFALSARNRSPRFPIFKFVTKSSKIGGLAWSLRG